MKVRAWFIVGIVLFSVSVGSAKSQWYEGVVVLKSDDVLVGQLSYNCANDVVQIKQEGKIFSYSAFQVSQFNFHDTDLKAIRKFISLPFEKQTGRYSDVFFELIIKNEVSLLRLENPYKSSGSSYSFGDGTTVSKHATDYDYYFEYKGIIFSSERFKHELKPLLNNIMNDKISEFIKDNGLNLNLVYDQILVVRFFNKMVDAGEGYFLTAY